MVQFISDFIGISVNIFERYIENELCRITPEQKHQETSSVYTKRDVEMYRSNAGTHNDSAGQENNRNILHKKKKKIDVMPCG